MPKKTPKSPKGLSKARQVRKRGAGYVISLCTDGLTSKEQGVNRANRQAPEGLGATSSSSG